MELGTMWILYPVIIVKLVEGFGLLRAVVSITFSPSLTCGLSFSSWADELLDIEPDDAGGGSAFSVDVFAPDFEKKGTFIVARARSSQPTR